MPPAKLLPPSGGGFIKPPAMRVVANCGCVLPALYPSFLRLPSLDSGPKNSRVSRGQEPATIPTIRCAGNYDMIV